MPPRKKSTTAAPGPETTALATKPIRTLMKIPEIEEQILNRMPALLQAMLDRALGHHVVVNKFNKELGEVETRIYLEPPDVKAAMFLMENVIGKVPQRHEITGEGGGPVKIVPWMSYDEATRLGLRDVIVEGDAKELPTEVSPTADGVWQMDERNGFRGDAPAHIAAAFDEMADNDGE